MAFGHGRGGGKFRSKTEAMNRRNDVWECKQCETWNHRIPKYESIKSETKMVKPDRCKKCGSTDFIYFPSTAEATRHGELKLLRRMGHIHQLKLQPRYPVKINSQLAFTYVADFVYRNKQGQIVIEDVKGNKDFMTADAKLKIKIFQLVYGVSVEIVERK